MKEKKFNWALASLRQMTSPDPTGLAMYTAEIMCRQLPRLILNVTFYGGVPKTIRGPQGDATVHQADCFIHAVCSVPQSIEALSRIGVSTSTKEAAADGLQDER